METILGNHTSPYRYLVSLYGILSFVRCLHITVFAGTLASEVLGPVDGVGLKFGLSAWNCLLVAYCAALTHTVPGVGGGVA